MFVKGVIEIVMISSVFSLSHSTELAVTYYRHSSNLLSPCLS
jgi:hypothetical protein